MINEVRGLDDALAEKARAVSITIPPKYNSETDLEELFRVLDREHGRCGVILNLLAGDTRVKLEASGVSVAPSRTLQRDLEERGCIVDWVH